MYDPQLGRFGQIDKLGDINFDISLYVYVKNNPISFNDPTGLIDDEPTKKKGKPGFSKDNPNILPDVIVKSSNHRFQTFGWYGYTTITDTHFSGNLASFIQRMRGNEDVLQPGDRYSYIDDVMNGKLLDWYLKEAEAKQFEEDFYSIYFGLVTLPEDVVGVVGIYGKGIRLLPKLTSSTSRVFYSGGPEARIAATAYAKAFDMVSMEMTIKGRILAALTKMTSKEFMKGAIEKTSASFAKGAEGTARVFHNVEGVPLDGIWKEHEYPNIRKEVNLIFHDVIP